MAGAVGPEAYARARKCFAYFASKESGVFMENAGGSQVPQAVVSAICEYFQHHYAQLGAGYPQSSRATQVVADAHRWVEVLMNAAGQGEVMLGPSTSQMAFNVASAYAGVLGPEDELVLQEASHESVVGPWVRVAARTGAAVRWWRADPGSGASCLEQLGALLGPRTRVVVVTHVSNLLGEILDVQQVVQRVRSSSPRAHVMVDGVAYAPHRAMDVSCWGVDWYLWSCYKVMGPHMAAMYGRRAALQELLAAGGVGPNHYWIQPGDFAYKFELGGVSHEGCAGLLALQDYLAQLLQLQPPPPAPWPAAAAAVAPHTDPPPPAPPAAAPASPAPPGSAPVARSLLARGAYLHRDQVEAAFAAMTAMEAPLQQRLLGFLSSHPRVVLLGAADPRVDARVPTVSFVHTSKGSRQLAQEIQAAGFHVRCGHMYARRLVEALAGPEGVLAARMPAVRQALAERQQQGQGQQGQGQQGQGQQGQGQQGQGQQGQGQGQGKDQGQGQREQGKDQGQGQEGQGQGGHGGGVSRWEALVEEGVVRVSLLHYNTPEEVEGLVAALERLL